MKGTRKYYGVFLESKGLCAFILKFRHSFNGNGIWELGGWWILGKIVTFKSVLGNIGTSVNAQAKILFDSCYSINL